MPKVDAIVDGKAGNHAPTTKQVSITQIGITQVSIAERKLENLDIRKLAKGNETMTKMFADLEVKDIDEIESE